LLADSLVAPFHVSQYNTFLARFEVAVRAGEIQNLPMHIAMRDSKKASALDAARRPRGEKQAGCAKQMRAGWAVHLLVDSLDMHVHILYSVAAT
jgi:hypothetical protein